jgi:copper chaperone CopZ
MNLQKITLNVPDMHCPSCPKIIQLTLLEMNGILGVDASLESRTVDVEYDPALIQPSLIIEAIQKLGYTPQPQP